MSTAYTFIASNPHAWISIIVFPICILFVIISPSLPIPLPTLTFLKSFLAEEPHGNEEEEEMEKLQDENETNVKQDHVDEQPEAPKQSDEPLNSLVKESPREHKQDVIEDDDHPEDPNNDDAEAIIYQDDSSVAIYEKETPFEHTHEELEELKIQGIESSDHSVQIVEQSHSTEIEMQDIKNLHSETSIFMDNAINQGPIIADPPPKSRIYEIWRVPLDMGVAPVLAILFMLCTTTITGEILKKGVIGDEFIQPYAILIIFFAPAYCCISIDVTGLFEFISHFIIAKSKNRGHVVFSGLLIFSSILTIFASNDVTILTLTPICCYMAKSSENLDFLPFVISQYFMANVWGMMLEIGNPTNVIVAEAYKIGFLEFSAWMAFPTLITGLLCFVFLYIVFYKRIPKIIVKKGVSHNNTKKLAVIKSIPHAIFKSIGLGIFLFFCSISSFIHFKSFKLDLWHVCALAAIGFIAYDIITDVILIVRKWKQGNYSLKDDRLLNYTFFDVLWKLPWKIIPFVIGMFIIVELLHFYGWISLVAQAYSKWMHFLVPNQTDRYGFIGVWSIIASTISMSFVSAISCNFLNSQPMTILFTTMINDPEFIMSPIMKLSSILALILGSNVGANMTLIGALCGLMWSEILKKNGMPVGYFRFLLYGLTITPIIILISSFVLATEIIIWNYTGFKGIAPGGNGTAEILSFLQLSP